MHFIENICMVLFFGLCLSSINNKEIKMAQKLELTIELISEAINASPYRGGLFDTYFHLCEDSLNIINEATKNGYIMRLSHTQAQWTESGLEKARKELKLK